MSQLHLISRSSLLCALLHQNPLFSAAITSWANLREAWFGEQAKRLIIVPYEHLVREPDRTLRRLYEELGESWFSHDFDNAVYDEPDYDALLGMPGLHKVRQKVEYQDRQPCVPPDVFAKSAGTSFWIKPELNTRNVKII